MSRQLLKQSDQTFFIDERRGFDIFGPNGYFVYCIWGEACNGVLVRPGLHSSHFYVIDAHSMLEVGVGWQPGDDGRGARNIAGSHAGGSQGCIFAYNHGASCVLRSFPVDRDRPDADAMRLEKKRARKGKVKKFIGSIEKLSCILDEKLCLLSNTATTLPVATMDRGRRQPGCKVFFPTSA